MMFSTGGFRYIKFIPSRPLASGPLNFNLRILIFAIPKLSLMKKLLVTSYLLLVTSYFAIGQTWSEVGKGLSPNITNVNSLYVSGQNRLIISNTSIVSPDSVMVWNDTAIIAPWDTIRNLVGCGFSDSFGFHDSVTYCATDYQGLTISGSLLGDFYSYQDTLYEYFWPNIYIDVGCPPVVNKMAVYNNRYLWYISNSYFYCYSPYIGYGLFDYIVSGAHCLLPYHNVLYVGGSIDSNHYPVIVFDSSATDSSSRYVSYSNSITKLSGSVWAMAVFNNSLYVGGDFPGNLARWNDTTHAWNVINGIPGTIYALQEYNGRLYIGGKFDSVYSYNDTLFSGIGHISAGDSVTSFAVYDSSLYVGGYFSDVNGVAHTTHLAKYNTPYVKPAKCSGYMATISVLEVDAKCGDTSKLAVVANAGTAPYTYLWSNGATTASIDSVSGIYSVTVTDGNGCKALTSANVNGPTPFKAKVCSYTGVKCYGETGCITACAVGGSKPYWYEWNDGQTTQQLCVSFPGTFTCDVIDSNGCVAAMSSTIIIPPPISIKTDSIDIAACNGAAWVKVSGGVSPYSYLWSNSATTDSISKLCAPGNYCCLVIDSNGCRDSVCIDVSTVSGINSLFNDIMRVLVCIRIRATAYLFFKPIANGH
jgi:hypothetical protein